MPAFATGHAFDHHPDPVQARRPLARHIDGFKARALQLEMAEAVSRAIKQVAVCWWRLERAPGKTYAYLVPALESGKRVVISTGPRICRSSSSIGICPPSRGRFTTPAGGTAQGAQQLPLHRADEPAVE